MSKPWEENWTDQPLVANVLLFFRQIKNGRRGKMKLLIKYD